jgi:transposase-like protein
LPCFQCRYIDYHRHSVRRCPSSDSSVFESLYRLPFCSRLSKTGIFSLIKGSLSNPPKNEESNNDVSTDDSDEPKYGDYIEKQSQPLDSSSRAEIRQILLQRKEAAAKICEDLRGQLLDIFEITRAFYSITYSELSDLVSPSSANILTKFRALYKKGNTQIFNAEFLIRFGLIFDVDLNTIINILVDWKTKSQLPENFYTAYSSFLNIQSPKVRERFASVIMNECLPTDDIIASYKNGDSFKQISQRYGINTATIRSIVAKEKRTNSSLSDTSIQRVKKKRISDEKKQMIVQLSKEGVYPQKIAETLGISIDSVYVTLRKEPQSETTLARKRMTEEKLAEIYDLLAGDKSIREVSDITGFSQTTISKYRKIVTERDAKANLQASPNASRASSKKSSPTPSSTDSKDGADTDASGPAK